MKSSRCIVVLGVAGSGTSSVAGTLHTLGVSMGEQLVGPGKATNPKGHFEDKNVRTWLDNIGRARGEGSEAGDVAAFREFIRDRAARFKIWGIKYPALAGTLDLFLDEIGPDWRMVCVERNAVASARSYAVKWNRTDIERIVELQNDTRRRRQTLLDRHRPATLWIHYNDLTNDPARHVQMLHDFAYEDMDKPSAARIQAAIDFIDPSLNHHRERPDQGDASEAPQPVPRDAIPRPNAGTSLDEIDGELVLFYTGKDKAVYVNETAALVWQLCDGDRSAHDIAVLLGKVYPESDGIRSDVEQALQQLVDIRAVRFGTREAR